METIILSSKLVQFGFAGICVILIGIIVWLVKRLLDVLEKNTMAFCANTEAINNNTRMIKEQKDVSEKIEGLLLTKPCIIDRR